ncbi:type 2 isopentenyl-diphosphate Delta-isomerase [Parvularcula sp. LCG005]|uniref:type 2 isopentenyl-diphosphate Delta-isomerase n=1 Tax=Parvularcula sp. LCG005 TaxID=3078805 RepID=UPI002941C1AD|nr:type 2 isopentenyl-diphosphate Delta-isomerase [Parvularcula sp. LCG005]WOI54765.1 type 2 isopentenyl-diphosphate Delta-isomerase [Parvularcula sp. LCG005]
MTEKTSSDIARRKADHIDIVLNGDVGFGRLSTGFERVQLAHNALPELDLSAVDLSARLFGRQLRAPFLISSMTGGVDRAEAINRHLAEAANALGIALAIGSQRIALEQQGAGGLSGELRRMAPDVPLIGNIGAAQLLDRDGVDRARAAIDMIDADGLFVHLNPLQEAVQKGGDTAWRGVLEGIARLVASDVPVAVKEVGFGLSAPVVRELTDIGVVVIDVAGAGGTNWARVEGARHPDERMRKIASAFTEWGVPTAIAVQAARKAASHATIIASGGIRNGVDAAKAIRLGADIVGQAAGTLEAAITSTEAVIEHFETVIETLKIACFCTGSANLAALRSAELVEL